MVSIPSKRKGLLGGGLVPLVLLVLVAGAILVGARASGALASLGVGRGDVVTNLPLGKPDKLDDLIDKRAELKGLTVLDVVGDKTFWVGRDTKERILVYLEEEKRPGQAVEGDVDVRAGQVVDVYAAITKLPSREQIQNTWDLTPEAFEVLKREQVYLYVANVRNLTIVSGP